MCERASRAMERPRWRWLYAVALTPLGALAVVETAAPPSLLRTLLRWTLALGAMVGIALWHQANRAALDLQDWCACAGATTIARVVPSRPATIVPEPTLDEPTPAVEVVERERALR
jgi:hypothetical protein